VEKISGDTSLIITSLDELQEIIKNEGKNPMNYEFASLDVKKT
jgi:hypothetical protein